MFAPATVLAVRVAGGAVLSLMFAGAGEVPSPQTVEGKLLVQVLGAAVVGDQPAATSRTSR